VINAKQKTQIILIQSILLFLFCTGANANEAKLSFIVENPANPLQLSLVIDHAVKIAGMKVVISFDKEALVLKHADKSKETSSFLHVVNDKIPGQIIFVMASASGVSGKNLTLCHFEFSKTGNTKQLDNYISVTQIQLMNEDLKEIKGNFPTYSFK
jgi:hypothetical protein